MMEEKKETQGKQTKYDRWFLHYSETTDLSKRQIHRLAHLGAKTGKGPESEPRTLHG